MTAVLLPDPPARREKFDSFRRARRRWVSVIMFLFSLGSVYGIWAVFSKSWVWWPFLLTLAVVIPWSLYTLYLMLQQPAVTCDSHAKASQDRALDRAAVDVFIPTCGESLDVLANTFRHVAALRWAGPLRVHVLDDSARGEVRDLAAASGFGWLARPDRGRMKKAGNLNHGLANSSGEFIVSFDADFAPSRDCAAHLIPHFTDPGVGIVQTAQFFDADKARTRNWMQRHAAVVQDMFFSWVQPARGTLDSAFCVGTNVAYRRAALDKAGGFPEVPDGEDIVTSWNLMSAGYRTLYLPLNLAKGLCPDTFDATVNQQYRWASSSWAVIAAPRLNRTRRAFWDCPMTLPQRLSFFSGVIYYLQSVLSLALAVVPSLVMLWCFPYQVGPGNYLPIVPAMIGTIFLPTVQRKWRPSVLRLVVLYAVVHATALWDTIADAQKEWVPTGTAEARQNNTAARTGWILRAWVVATQGLAWWGLCRDIPVYGMPAYWPAAVLTLYQSIVFFPLLLPGYYAEPYGQVITRLAKKGYKYACDLGG